MRGDVVAAFSGVVFLAGCSSPLPSPPATEAARPPVVQPVALVLNAEWKAVLRRANTQADAVFAAEPAKTAAKVRDIEAKGVDATTDERRGVAAWRSFDVGRTVVSDSSLGYFRRAGLTEFAEAICIRNGQRSERLAPALRMRFEVENRGRPVDVDREAARLVEAWTLAGAVMEPGGIGNRLVQHYEQSRTEPLPLTDAEEGIFRRLIAR